MCQESDTHGEILYILVQVQFPFLHDAEDAPLKGASSASCRKGNCRRPGGSAPVQHVTIQSQES